jgi:hypothetical protein
MTSISNALLALTLTTAPAWAQSAPASVSDLSDRFKIDIGGFRLSADTTLKLNGPNGEGTDINFENELRLPKNANTIWVDGSWRLTRRNEVKLAYTQAGRTGDPVTLNRDIIFGDTVFPASLTAHSTSSSHIVTGYYRFAAYRNDRFEIGPTVGLGYLWLTAGIHGTGSITGVNQTASGSFDKDAKTSSATADIGGYFSVWLARRVELRGDLLYIIVKPGDSEASVTDGAIGLDWYPWKKVGFGGQYKYYKYRYDRDPLSTDLGGTITYQGGQVYLSFRP